jgi:hypothetical protein
MAAFLMLSLPFEGRVARADWNAASMLLQVAESTMRRSGREERAGVMPPVLSRTSGSPERWSGAPPRVVTVRHSARGGRGRIVDVA